jgi:hypothetical protein
MPSEYSLFRILGENRRAEKAYQGHLRRIRRDIPRDLWLYFVDHYFHDGEMHVVRYDVRTRRLELVIDAPNIKKRKGDDFEYVTVKYRCVFEGVDHFRASASYGSPRSDYRPWYYLAGEVETIPHNPADRQRPRRSLHSLVIEADPGWLEIVFRELTVRPVQPARVRAMRADRHKYHFPLAGRKAPAWAIWRPERKPAG